MPKQTWADPQQYDEMAAKLTGLFHENFANYADKLMSRCHAAQPSRDYRE